MFSRTSKSTGLIQRFVDIPKDRTFGVAQIRSWRLGAFNSLSGFAGIILHYLADLCFFLFLHHFLMENIY